MSTFLTSKAITGAPQGSNSVSNVVTIESMKETKLSVESAFANDNDYICRTFGNYFYAIDFSMYQLHVLSLKNLEWNFSSLQDLGINLD